MRMPGYPMSVLTTDGPLSQADVKDGIIHLYELDARNSATLYRWLSENDFLLKGDMFAVAYPNAHFDGRTLILGSHPDLPKNTLWLTNDPLHSQLRKRQDRIRYVVAPLAERRGDYRCALETARHYDLDYLAKHDDGQFTPFAEMERVAMLQDPTALGYLRIIRNTHPAYYLIDQLEDEETMVERAMDFWNARLVFLNHRELDVASQDPLTQVCRVTERRTLALIQLGDWARGVLLETDTMYHVSINDETLGLFQGYLKCTEGPKAIPTRITCRTARVEDGALALSPATVVAGPGVRH